MTISEFLARIDSNDKWIMSKRGFIRDSQGRCPILHVSEGRKENNGDADFIGETKLSLAPKDARNIIRASDNFVGVFGDLREKIIAKCNLQQKETKTCII